MTSNKIPAQPSNVILFPFDLYRISQLLGEQVDELVASLYEQTGESLRSKDDLIARCDTMRERLLSRIAARRARGKQEDPIARCDRLSAEVLDGLPPAQGDDPDEDPLEQNSGDSESLLEEARVLLSRVAARSAARTPPSSEAPKHNGADNTLFDPLTRCALALAEVEAILSRAADRCSAAPPEVRKRYSRSGPIAAETAESLPRRMPPRHFKAFGSPAEQRRWRKHILRNMRQGARDARKVGERFEKVADRIEKAETFDGSVGERLLYDAKLATSKDTWHQRFGRLVNEAAIVRSLVDQLLGRCK